MRNIIDIVTDFIERRRSVESITAKVPKIVCKLERHARYQINTSARHMQTSILLNQRADQAAEAHKVASDKADSLRKLAA